MNRYRVTLLVSAPDPQALQNLAEELHAISNRRGIEGFYWSPLHDSKRAGRLAFSAPDSLSRAQEPNSSDRPA